MDPHFLWSAALTIGMAIIGGFVGLGAYLLKQIKNTLEQRMNQHDQQISAVNQRIENTQEDLSEYKILVQRKFVNQEEYIRTTQGMDAKIDRILVEINKLSINLARIAAMQEVNQNVGE